MENPYKVDFEILYRKSHIKICIENPHKNLKIKRRLTVGPGRR
jgi:hypothetical protein